MKLQEIISENPKPKLKKREKMVESGKRTNRSESGREKKDEPDERTASFQEGLGRLKVEGGGEEEAEDGSKQGMMRFW